MKESYYETTNNICTVNFALKQDNVTIYPDLIKVSVAMDDGEILSMDARGYILNHIERKITAPTISEEAAKKSVSNKLKIESVSEVIIPTSGLNEAHCYEFVTRGENDEHILVYINAETGAEEEILVLLESEDGVLTK